MAAPLDVSILGCGSVGRALTLGLTASTSDAPAAIRLWSRRSRRANALVAEVPRWDRPPTVRAFQAVDALLDAPIVLLCVADEGYEELAATLGAALAATRATPTVLIASGFVPLAVLDPLVKVGATPGRFHPLAPVLPKGDPRALTAFALEGPPRALRDGRRLARALGGRELLLRTGKGLSESYHAGAALLGGGLVALLAEAEAAMAPSVRSRTNLREALVAFAGEVLRNVSADGPARALTGPVARGSEALLGGHLQALARHPRARAAYRQLAASMLELARLEPAVARRLQRLLR
jgi:predicted short-subunit dehydrogenase-like oxidoreductase (DUF2520 family)